MSTLFAYCTLCSRIVGSHGCLLQHVYMEHASVCKADTEHIEGLLKSRPDLRSIINAPRFGLPDSRPNDVPPGRNLKAGWQTVAAALTGRAGNVDIHCGRAEERIHHGTSGVSTVQEISTSSGRLTYNEDEAGKEFWSS
jgi:hypothetical protein